MITGIKIGLHYFGLLLGYPIMIALAFFDESAFYAILALPLVLVFLELFGFQGLYGRIERYKCVAVVRFIGLVELVSLVLNLDTFLNLNIPAYRHTPIYFQLFSYLLYFFIALGIAGFLLVKRWGLYGYIGAMIVLFLSLGAEAPYLSTWGLLLFSWMGLETFINGLSFFYVALVGFLFLPRRKNGLEINESDFNHSVVTGNARPNEDGSSSQRLMVKQTSHLGKVFTKLLISIFGAFVLASTYLKLASVSYLRPYFEYETGIMLFAGRILHAPYDFWNDHSLYFFVLAGLIFCVLFLGLLRQRWLPCLILFVCLVVYLTILYIPGTPCDYTKYHVSSDIVHRCECWGIKKQKSAPDFFYSVCIGIAKEKYARPFNPAQ